MKKTAIALLMSAAFVLPAHAQNNKVESGGAAGSVSAGTAGSEGVSVAGVVTGIGMAAAFLVASNSGGSSDDSTGTNGTNSGTNGPTGTN